MEKIKELLAERAEITKLTDEEYDIVNIEIDDKYGVNETLILAELSNKFDDLSVDFILETLIHLGWAPCVIYDDEGNWAVDGGGVSNVRMTDEEEFQFSTVIEGKQFKPTIKEALKLYFYDSK